MAVSDLFATIPDAIATLAEGGMLILVDDEARENEGDFVFAAEHVTPERINFLATEGRGLICVAAPTDRLARLGLTPPPPDANTSLMGTNFTESVDAREGVSTGISAADRARTVQTLADADAAPEALARPGHIFPIAAREGGVLTRAGHTEGTVDLCRLAALTPVGVLCEILNPDGTMARLSDLRAVAERHGLPIVTIKDLIEHRRRTEQLVRRVTHTTLPNEFGIWDMTLYEETLTGEDHVALSLGPIGPDPTLVRVHSKCLTGDTLGSLRCDCGAQLNRAMRMVAEAGCGVVLYMNQEGRGIGLKNKIRAYALQDRGRDTVEANEDLGFQADLREYGVGAQILADLGLRRLRLMTNYPRKIVGLEAYGLEVVERVPIEVGRGEHNERYLDTKRSRLGHILGEKDRI